MEAGSGTEKAAPSMGSGAWTIWIPATAATARTRTNGLRTARCGGKQAEFLADFLAAALWAQQGLGLVHGFGEVLVFVATRFAEKFVNRHCIPLSASFRAREEYKWTRTGGQRFAIKCLRDANSAPERSR